MLEPPSTPLTQLLRDLRLCTLADLRRCRGRVRKLATDLPAFDSVWIDALVQMNRLTPFQAQILESSEPQRLRVGPCVLVDRLGGGFHGTTYLARGIQNRQLRVLKVVRNDAESRNEIFSRARLSLPQATRIAHPSIVMPQSCESVQSSLVFVSRYVPGRMLTEFLIRRGRFPSRVVWQIGRQLADGLARLHSLGLAHGDIRPSQVRLLSEGTAVLVDTCVTPILEPELSPHSQLAPECYDCVAPELIGTGVSYNAASDLYALGCLLWQLLAGRPPFPGGDPLQKLAAHQTRRIRDVRDFAPDTPAPLAEMIWRLTSPNVADRPGSAAAVLKVWGNPRSSGRHQLRQFVASFERPVEADFRISSLANSPVAWLMALLLCVSGATAGMYHDGARTHLLAIWSKLGAADTVAHAVQSATNPGAAASDEPSGSRVVTNATQTALLELPQPNAHGVIELSERGPYAAKKISQVGQLTIQSRSGIAAEIVVGQEPLLLVAETVLLKGISVHPANSEDRDPVSSPTALVQIESLRLDIEDCAFVTGPISLAAPDTEHALDSVAKFSSAISWKVAEVTAPHSGIATLKQLVFRGSGAAFDLRGTARRITVNNVLGLGNSALFNIGVPLLSKAVLQLELEHVTCRQAGALICWQVNDERPVRQLLRVSAKNCVLDMIPDASALFVFDGRRYVSDWLKQVRFLGDVCLISEHAEIALRRSPSGDSSEPLESSELELEGVTQDHFEFSGAFDVIPSHSSIRSDYQGVQSRTGLPGIMASTLPGAKPERSRLADARSTAR